MAHIYKIHSYDLEGGDDDVSMYKKRVRLVSAAGFRNLSALSSDTPGQLNILRHNGHSLGMDGAQVCVFE